MLYGIYFTPDSLPDANPFFIRRGISTKRTQYICAPLVAEFTNKNKDDAKMDLRGIELTKVKEYLGLTEQNNGEHGREVKKRVSA